jgi:nucleoside-diphosphate-sugar epimerase
LNALDRAIELNVKGALRMFDVALACTNCVAFVHVSTAYVNCNQPTKSVVKEKLYPLGFEPDRVLEEVSKMNTQQLSKIADTGMLRDWPNTYTFTKAITEHKLVKKHKKPSNRRIALAIVRPAIVTAAWREPLPGWVDDISAASAIYAGGAIGVLKFVPATNYRHYDLVPVDLVANAIIIAAPAVLATPVSFIEFSASVY